MALDAINNIYYNTVMGAELIIHEKLILDVDSLIEIRVWKVPNPVLPTTHGLKYSAVYIENKMRIIGYDNELGKGDHRHYMDKETPYIFESIEKLIADFRNDVERIRGEKI